MQIGKRALALLLAMLMLVSLTACNKGGDQKSSNSNQAGSSDVSTSETIRKKDLGGYEFTVIDFAENRWNKEMSGTPFLDAWQDMMENVEREFNCTIKKLPSVSPGEIINQAQPEIAAGGKFADLICTTQWAYGYYIASGLMLDLNKLDVNWDAPWWNQRIRQMSTIQGATYAATGSFIFDAQHTWMIYFNRNIWDELNLPDPYKLVDDGKWTIDLFNDYAKMALRDNDGNGVVDSLDDRWGVIAPGGDFIRALYLGGGNHFFEIKDGKVQLAMNKPETYDFVSKMRALNIEKKAFCKVPISGGMPAFVDMFKRDKALFFSYMPGIDGLQDMESDWGVLPMPKANEQQPTYLSGIDHNAVVCGVTNTNTNLEEVSYILDGLGYYGMALEEIYWPDYRETYWRNPELDAEVIRNHVAHRGQPDIAQLMQNVKPVFAYPLNLLGAAFSGSIMDLASAVETQKPVIDQAVDEFFNGEGGSTSTTES